MSRLTDREYAGNKKGTPGEVPQTLILERVFSRLILLPSKYYFEYFFV
jgi:hypothetical protein